MVIKKVLFILAGLATTTFGLVYGYQKLRIKSIKPEIENGFYAVNLNGSDSTESPFDSVPFDELLKDKSIISFGEATHGTDEFRKAFKELAKTLVLQGKCNIIIFAERDFSDSWKINDYVTNKSDLASISSILPYSSLHEKELISWLKKYNEGKSEEEKVLVFGADCYTTRTAALNSINYCRSNNLTLPTKTEEFLNDLAFSPALYNTFLDKYSMNEMLTSLEPLNKMMDSTATRTSNTKESLILESIRDLGDLIKYSVLAMPHRLSSGLRDSLMFKNVLWATNQKANPQLLIFGHNSHLEKTKANALTANNSRLGWLLQQKYNDRYYAIATEVEKGKYRAKNNTLYSVPQSRNKIGSIISQCDLGIMGFLNLHSSDKLENFFNNKHYITFGNIDAGTPTYPAVENFAKAYDAVFWIEESSPMAVSNSNIYNFITMFSKKKQPALFDENKMNLKVRMSYERDKPEAYYYDTPSIGLVSFSKTKLLDYYVQEFPVNKEYLILEKYLSPNVDSLVVFIVGDNTKKININDITINSTHTIKAKNLLYSAPSYVKSENGSQGLSFSLGEHKRAR